MLLRFIILSTLFLIAACSNNNLPVVKLDDKLQGEFPFNWINQLNFAYNDFEKFGYNNSCYLVGFDLEGDHYFISFAPKKEVIIEGDKITISTGVDSECGNGVTYLFDSKGKFIKRHFIR